MHFHRAERLGAEATRYALHRKNPVDGSWCCGTVITVPYRMVARRGDSRIARRPNGAGKSFDVKNGKNNRTSHRLPLSLRGRKPVAICSLSVPQRGTGGALHRRGRGLPRPCGPRNDVVVLAGPSDLGGWLLVRGRFVNRPYDHTFCRERL